jgi:hypothetical protein
MQDSIRRESHAIGLAANRAKCALGNAAEARFREAWDAADVREFERAFDRALFRMPPG